VRDSHIVLIADAPAFAHDLMARWQIERNLPGITVMSTDFLTGISEGNFDLAIVAAVRNKRVASVLKILDGGDYPVICIMDNAADLKMARIAHPRLHVMQSHEAWLESLLLLAAACLKRVDFTERVRRAEKAALASSQGATLGRYMLESRHDLNNSLTSVLGNAELLLLKENELPESARDQLQTIHEMALHMHDIMQRFSSVAAEVRAPENPSQDEIHKPSHPATSIQ
jgi:K+-sensing histidine kinase KdpD